MRGEKFSRLFEQVCRGVQIDSRSVSAWDRSLVVGAINDFLQVAWRWGRWPEWCFVSAVARADEVFDESVMGWRFALPAEVRAGDVLDVLAGPDARRFRSLDYGVSAVGLVVREPLARVWVVWRRRFVAFTYRLWMAGGAFVPGDVVCFEGEGEFKRECFVCVRPVRGDEPEARPDLRVFWRWLPVPSVLFAAAEAGAQARIFKGRGDAGLYARFAQEADALLADAASANIPQRRASR